MPQGSWWFAECKTITVKWEATPKEQPELRGKTCIAILLHIIAILYCTEAIMKVTGWMGNCCDCGPFKGPRLCKIYFYPMFYGNNMLHQLVNEFPRNVKSPSFTSYACFAFKCGLKHTVLELSLLWQHKAHWYLTELPQPAVCSASWDLQVQCSYPLPKIQQSIHFNRKLKSIGDCKRLKMLVSGHLVGFFVILHVRLLH